MIVSIHQPSYFPWLGLVSKIANSDKFILMDQVQLSDAAFQHRNLFLANDGKAKYLTIPFVRKGYLEKEFRELRIANSTWRGQHLSFIENNYKKHPFYSEIIPHLREFYSAQYEYLIDAIMASMNLLLDLLDIKTTIEFQSNIEYDESARRGDLVLSLLRTTSAKIYLSGEGAKQYQDSENFYGDIQLMYNNFSHPKYQQKNADNFIPGLSCIDMLFNIGIAESRKLIASKIIK